MSALALPARSLNRSAWAELLGFAGVRNGSRVIATTELKTRGRAWCEAGVLSERAREEYELSPAMRHALLMELARAKQLQHWLAAYASVVIPRGFSSLGVPEMHIATARVHMYDGRHDELRQSLEAYRLSAQYSLRHEAPGVVELLGVAPVLEAARLLPDDLVEQYVDVVSERSLSLLVPFSSG